MSHSLFSPEMEGRSGVNAEGFPSVLLPSLLVGQLLSTREISFVNDTFIHSFDGLFENASHTIHMNNDPILDTLSFIYVALQPFHTHFQDSILYSCAAQPLLSI